MDSLLIEENESEICKINKKETCKINESAKNGKENEIEFWKKHESNIFNENVEETDVLEKIRKVCPFCNRSFSSEKKVERHVGTRHKKKFKCDVCSKALSTHGSLEAHKASHGSNYFFECLTCHVKYKSKHSLTRHRMQVHEKIEPVYVCEQCGRSYHVKSDLTAHIKKSHPFEVRICRYCGKEVADITGHEYLHQRRARKKLYKYTCHLCSQRFCYRSYLDKHTLRHENGFKCNECDSVFINGRDLKNHKSLKHSFLNTCIFCQKVFRCLSNFHQHVLTHAGIRPYKCDICEEDFTQRSSLLRHRKSHSGPLPPFVSSSPQVADLAKSFIQKFKNRQIADACLTRASS